MRCPALSELPPPPPGKTGWPWTIESPQLPDAMPDGKSWPRISIVTPSYNQGQFIEETIRSVLLQGYPDLEYIVMDGGSTDTTVEIISRYERWLAHWVSERDNGQADALNKGLVGATGEMFQFVNSDDILQPGVLHRVSSSFSGYDVVAGNVIDFSESVRYVKPNRGLSARALIKGKFNWKRCCYHQPGIWLRTQNLRQLGGFQSEFRYCFDLLLYVRYLERWPRVRYVPGVLAQFRLHECSKSISEIDSFNIEYASVRHELSHCLRSRDLRRLSGIVARNIDWHKTVADILELTSKNSFRALAELTFLVSLAPLERIDRFTAGAARRLVLRGVRKAFAP